MAVAEYPNKKKRQKAGCHCIFLLKIFVSDKIQILNAIFHQYEEKVSLSLLNCWSIIYWRETDVFFNLTLYPAQQGTRLVLKHSVPHSPPQLPRHCRVEWIETQRRVLSCYYSEETKIINSPKWEPNPPPSRLQSDPTTTDPTIIIGFHNFK